MNAHTRINETDATAIPSPVAPLVTSKGAIVVADHKIGITFFQNEFASSMTVKEITLAELGDLILVTKGKTKSDLPWLKGARFGGKRTDKASLRSDENVLGFDLIELDYDKEVMSFDEAITVIKAMEVRALIYTTPSHTNAAPRWRLLLPVSRGDLPVETRAKLCARVNGRFSGIFANESFTLSQSYYFGLALDNPEPDHRCEVIDGRLIDLCDDLYKFQANGGPVLAVNPYVAHGKTAAGKSGTPGNFYDKNFNFEANLKSIGDGGDLKGFNEPLTKATASYAYHHGTDFDVEVLKTRLREAIEAAPKKPTRKTTDITRYLSDAYLDETIASAIKKFGVARQNGWGDFDWRERKANGQPSPSMHNARLAITALGIDCSMDTFHNKTLFGYHDDIVTHELSSILGEVSDNGIIALRQLMSDRFGFDLTDKHTRDAVVSLALEHCFDPVRDLIDKAEAEWDGTERLDRMAVDYFNCDDTPINRAFMRKTMIGLVARARSPGCKFDTIIVLESKEGFAKSTAWKVLAGDENFSDESIIGKAGREVQEQLSEVWIHENADLAGMKKADITSVKAYASRMIDIARPAFGHFVVKQPRHSIEVGTTNSSEYLQSQTGNRRFWPLEVKKSIDIKKLTADRMQLIGEAAKCQSAGESITLDEALWVDAGVEQEQRRVKDPWEDALEYIPVWHKEIRGVDENKVPVEHLVLMVHIEGLLEIVLTGDLMKHVLDIPIAYQTPATAMRLATVMKQLGWERHKNGQVTIRGERQKGYFRSAKIRQDEVRERLVHQEKARQEDFQAEVREAKPLQ
jgi:predicted P-loop ATPase